MPTQIAYELTNSRGRYGPIQQNFKFAVPKGYSVLVGRNDSGKSALLQFIFKSLFESDEQRKDKICLVTQDRQYARHTTQPPTNLRDYNQHLYQQMVNSHKPSVGPVGPDSGSLYTLLLHRTNFVRQLQTINRYLIRLGFSEIVLKDVQIVNLDNVEIHFHGSGIRCVMPVLAALTSPDILVVLIDEPELSLEARAQRVLKGILLEAVCQETTILVATQSHIFLDKEEIDRNFVVTSSGGQLGVEFIRSKEHLIDVTYNLLGNSLEDLFFPSNFLIVEGSSDQSVCERVSKLSNIPVGRVKIISARGIDNVQDSYRAIENALVPLIADHSPYSRRVVVLLDKPSDEAKKIVESVARQLNERCVILPAASIEEYIPAEIYQRAGRDKANDLKRLEDTRKEVSYGSSGSLARLCELKNEISSALSSGLDASDLDQIPVIRDAVKLADSKASGGS